jgi:hypothetical protein
MPRTRDASRRARAAAAVALLLLLAGCGGFVPSVPEPADDGATDAPRTDPVPNETVGANVSFPDGFSRTRITIATARERSVAFLRTEPVTGVAFERFRAGAYVDYEYEATPTQTRFRLDVHNGYVDVTRSDVYVDDGVRYARNARNREIAFGASNGSVAETRFRAADSMWAVASRIVTVADVRAVRTVEEGDRRLIRYTVTGVAVPEATDVRGYLTVDRDGVVREARLAYAQVGESKRFEYVVGSRAAGERVAPPAWLPAAHTDAAPESDDGGGTTAQTEATTRAAVHGTPTARPARIGGGSP